MYSIKRKAKSKTLPTLQFEKKLWRLGLDLVVGVDEVGRGCIAGPVVAAAVVFEPNHQIIAGIDDSKRLSAKKRLNLAAQIKAEASYWSLGWGSVELINDQGIMPALTKAISQSLDSLQKLDHILFDGIYKPKLEGISPDTITTIKKGDQLSYSIAAASILAKVARDEYMHQLHQEFPDFDWCNNKGYGTLKHRQALSNSEPTCHHRSLFIRNVVGEIS